MQPLTPGRGTCRAALGLPLQTPPPPSSSLLTSSHSLSFKQTTCPRSLNIQVYPYLKAFATAGPSASSSPEGNAWLFVAQCHRLTEAHGDPLSEDVPPSHILSLSIPLAFLVFVTDSVTVKSYSFASASYTLPRAGASISFTTLSQTRSDDARFLENGLPVPQRGGANSCCCEHVTLLIPWPRSCSSAVLPREGLVFWESSSIQLPTIYEASPGFPGPVR